MKVRLTLRALRDLEDISDYIRARHPAAAQRVREDVQHAFRLLTLHPLAGRAYAGRRRRFALARFPYLIFYRIDEAADVIEVLTIRHGARDPRRS